MAKFQSATAIILGATSLLLICRITDATVTFRDADETPKRNVSNRPGELDASLQSQERGLRDGKGLLDLIGLGTGPDTDPYLGRTNEYCLNGDLAECFKSRALSSLDEFFQKDNYVLNDNARVIRLPDLKARSIGEDFEFSATPREEDSDWEQFSKFIMRKVEKFMKTTAIELKFPSEETRDGRYSPRFIEDIASEVDILEDKHDTKFSRIRLKKLLVPLLIILKLFKIKLLLFLPLILGLASFKKVLGFLALAIPGVIGYLRFCKPDMLHNGYGSHGHSSFYRPPPHRNHPPPHLYGGGGGGAAFEQYAPGSYYGDGGGYQRDNAAPTSGSSATSVAFRDGDDHRNGGDNGADIAYQGYSHFKK